ncbi:acyltransferase family protein [Microbacterium nymphoidis]|uniref:acyltransferase family protein n=1 Tax=Microbacterium nymphoidis TaxID=2898586 RepID=UPI001E28D6D3|nr:acyltransferase [Microbacterium nymphoidis]MCD2498279.1 acyltransferase [Microbacterium nymphoidis]
MALVSPFIASPSVSVARPVSPRASTAAAIGALRPASSRDGSVDAVRAVLLGIVVLLHAFMVGVGRDETGAPLLENAMEHWAGFPALTWVVQIMPLFFVLGGFASFTQWTRLRERGTTASDYVAARVRRLLIPAGGAITAIAVFLAALVISGVPAEVVSVAGFRIGQPFWFLAVYLGCSALVPAMVRLHERHRLLTLAVLAAGAVTVDIVRVATGAAAIGLVNMAFVWLLMQQIGFSLADQRFDRVRPSRVAMVGAGAVLTLAITMLTGFYPADLLSALNPPMGALVLLGIAQLSLFLLLRTALRRVADGRASAVITWVNARAMTIYSWHMLVVVALAGSLLLLPMDLPAPLSTDWWATRPLWLAGVVIAVAALVALVGRREARRPSPATGVRAPWAAAATVIAAAAVVLALLAGSAPSAWVIAAALAPIAVGLASRAARSAG